MDSGPVSFAALQGLFGFARNHHRGAAFAGRECRKQAERRMAAAFQVERQGKKHPRANRSANIMAFNGCATGQNQ